MPSAHRSWPLVPLAAWHIAVLGNIPRPKWIPLRCGCVTLHRICRGKQLENFKSPAIINRAPFQFENVKKDQRTEICFSISKLLCCALG